mgnify:CR=1 FL=1
MSRKPERTRYFVGTQGPNHQALSVAVDIGSPADKAAPARTGGGLAGTRSRRRT